MYNLKCRGILLLVYLLVFVQQLAGQEDSYLLTKYFSHQHEDYADKHHEHHFHIGIFHFLGHLFESISLVDGNADDHYVVTQKLLFKSKSELKKYFNRLLILLNPLNKDVRAGSLADPPFYRTSYLQKLIYSSSPLRAPPNHF